MKTQKKLIKAIKKIDKKAAKYLKSKKFKKEANFILKDATKLWSWFEWVDSPQGYDYWDKISDKVDYV